LQQESTNWHLQIQASERIRHYVTIETTPNFLLQVNVMKGMPNERGANVTGEICSDSVARRSGRSVIDEAEGRAWFLFETLN
jgi:hypothetical protein